MAIALPVVNGADSLALVIEASTTLLALIEVRPSLSPVIEPAAMSAAMLVDVWELWWAAM